MSLLGLNILVVGGGIGGFCAAIALAQRGAQVKVLERSTEISEVGAGIQISPNGMRVLEALGLGPEFTAASIAAQAVELRDYRASRLVTRLDLTRLGDDQHYRFLHRANLIEILSRAAQSIGVHIALGQTVSSVQSGRTPTVTFASGETETADLIVAADGLHSVGRQVLTGTSAPFFTGQVAWRAIVPNVIGHPPVARIHMAPKRHMVSYPLRGGDWVNLVGVQEKAEWSDESWASRDTQENMRAVFSDFSHDVRHLISKAQDIGKWGLFRHTVARKWHDENLVILGDAAHPTLPFMAQGAVMAIEDAWVLSSCLASTDSVDAGLQSYQQARLARVQKLVKTASGNARKYHLSFGPLRFAAHNVMRLGGALAPGKMMAQFDWIYRHDVTKTHP